MNHPIYHFLANSLIDHGVFEDIQNQYPCERHQQRGVLVIRDERFDFRISSREKFAALYYRLIDAKIPDPNDEQARLDWSQLLQFLRVVGTSSFTKVNLVRMTQRWMDLPFWSAFWKVFMPSTNTGLAANELGRLRTFLAKKALPALMSDMTLGDSLEGLNSQLTSMAKGRNLVWLTQPPMSDMIALLRVRVCQPVEVLERDDWFGVMEPRWFMRELVDEMDD